MNHTCDATKLSEYDRGPPLFAIQGDKHSFLRRRYAADTPMPQRQSSKLLWVS